MLIAKHLTLIFDNVQYVNKKCKKVILTRLCFAVDVEKSDVFNPLSPLNSD